MTKVTREVKSHKEQLGARGERVLLTTGLRNLNIYVFLLEIIHPII